MWRSSWPRLTMLSNLYVLSWKVSKRVLRLRSSHACSTITNRQILSTAAKPRCAAPAVCPSLRLMSLAAACVDVVASPHAPNESSKPSLKAVSRQSTFSTTSLGLFIAHRRRGRCNGLRGPLSRHAAAEVHPGRRWTSRAELLHFARSLWVNGLCPRAANVVAHGPVQRD